MAASANVQAVVNELVAMPDGNGNISNGFFPSNTFFKRVLNKPNAIIHGAGDKVKVPHTLAGMTATIGASPYVDIATSSEANFTSMSFDYQYISVSDLLSEVEIEQSSDAQAANLLKCKINNLNESLAKKINLGVYTGDNASASVLAGLPTFWTTSSTYGGLARATYTTTLALTTAYVPATAHPKFGSGSTYPTAQQTRWDCTSATISGKTNEEIAVSLISTLYSHIAEDGDEPDLIVCSKSVYDQLLTFQNEKSGIDKYGMQKSVTASDGAALNLYGAAVVRDSAVPSGEVFILNTAYVHIGAPAGFDPKKSSPVVQDFPTKIRMKSISDLKVMTLFTRNSCRQGWLQAIPN